MALDGQPQEWRKWSPERLKKFKATMAAKRKAKEEKATESKSKRKYTKREDRNPQVTDAVVYLRQAVRYINRIVAEGQEEDPSHLLTKLALKTLQGKM